MLINPCKTLKDFSLLFKYSIQNDLKSENIINLLSSLFVNGFRKTPAPCSDLEDHRLFLFFIIYFKKQNLTTNSSGTYFPVIQWSETKEWGESEIDIG